MRRRNVIAAVCARAVPPICHRHEETLGETPYLIALSVPPGLPPAQEGAA